MSKRRVVEIYFNTLEQYFPARKVVMISKVSRAGFPNIFSGDHLILLTIMISFVKLNSIL